MGWLASRLVELLLAFPLCVVVFFWPSSPRSSTSRNLPPMPATPRKWSSTLFRPATLTTSSSFSPANTGSATVDKSFVDGLESLSIHSVHPPPVSTPCGSRGRCDQIVSPALAAFFRLYATALLLKRPAALLGSTVLSVGGSAMVLAPKGFSPEEAYGLESCLLGSGFAFSRVLLYLSLCVVYELLYHW